MHHIFDIDYVQHKIIIELFFSLILIQFHQSLMLYFLHPLILHIIPPFPLVYHHPYLAIYLVKTTINIIQQNSLFFTRFDHFFLNILR